MSYRRWTLFLLGVGALLLGAPACKKEQPPAPAPSPVEKETALRAASSPPGPRAASEAASGQVGVPECDEYLKKYERCINSAKVPEGARPSMQQGVDATREAWRNAAATPSGKKSLLAACTTAFEMTRKGMAGYQCEW